MNNYEKAYQLLEKLGVIEIIKENKDSAKSVVPGFMDLNLDILSIQDESVTIALSHYGKQNGDAMADPDMELRVWNYGAVEALSYTNHYVGVYQQVYPYGIADGRFSPALKKKLISFLVTWLRNAVNQKHTFVVGA